ncbi:hypothetical protein ACFVHW_10065 [Streptomyces sp. NPDC127110]
MCNGTHLPAPGGDGIPDPSQGRPGVPGGSRDIKKIALDPAESSAIERQ